MASKTIDLDSGRYRTLTTAYSGVIDVSSIGFNNGESGYSEGRLNLHVSGDPGKVSSSFMEFGRNRVRTFAFADLAGGFERAGCTPQEGSGEVSVIVVIEANVPDSTMARAAITANEGITAALQDLRRRYGGLNASGMVRQDLTIVCNRASEVSVRGAGNHSKMGEIIGASVIEAVKSSARMNGFEIKDSMTVTKMMESFGYKDVPDIQNDINTDGKFIAVVSSVMHIIDCIRWGLIPEEEGTAAGKDILKSCFGHEAGGQNLSDALAGAIAEHNSRSQ
jgi:hypothetical protein